MMAAQDRRLQHPQSPGNVIDYLLEPARQELRQDQPYLITPERTWTFGELGEGVNRAADFLRSIGVDPVSASFSASSTASTSRRFFSRS